LHRGDTVSTLGTHFPGRAPCLIGATPDGGHLMRVATGRVLLMVGLAVALAISSTGCVRETRSSLKPSSGMGMSGGSASGGMGAGAIAMSRDASMCAPVFDADAGTIVVSRVLAPADGWVVARSTAATAGVLGCALVRKGENADVTVRLSAVDTHQVRVALFVDRGSRGTLDFNPDRPSLALDKPVVVDRAPVELPLTLKGWGAPANPGSVLVMVEDQPAGPTLDIVYLIVPAQSWIEVRRIEKGVPTTRLGVLLRPGGEFQHVKVPIKGAKPRDELQVTILADNGIPGRFEPAGRSPVDAIDQPWVSAGTVASQRVRLR
jgi:hypothetical protein